MAYLHICSLHPEHPSVARRYGCLVSGGIEPTRRQGNANWARLADFGAGFARFGMGELVAVANSLTMLRRAVSTSGLAG